MLTAIVAMDKNRGIGHDNKLLFRIRPDMQNFKETTITPDRNGIVIMGRKTWESLPKRPLMNRKNIIISNQSNENILGSDREDTWKHGYFGNIDHSASCQVLNMAEVEDFIEQGNRREEMMFIIGGGSIYEHFLPQCHFLIATEFDKEYDADTFFPEFKREFIEDEHISSGWWYDKQFTITRYKSRWCNYRFPRYMFKNR